MVNHLACTWSQKQKALGITVGNKDGDDDQGLNEGTAANKHSSHFYHAKISTFFISWMSDT